MRKLCKPVNSESERGIYMKTVLVTGAAGLIGKAVTEMLSGYLSPKVTELLKKAE